MNTLSEVWREEACLFEGMSGMLHELIALEGVRLGIITRNITIEPEQTLTRLTQQFEVPEFLIPGSPSDLQKCLRNALA